MNRRLEILPDGTVERTRTELEAEVERLLCENYALKEEATYATEWKGEAERLREENERIWHIVEEMRTTWKPADHCDECAHLRMELRQHKDVRKHYLAENARLRSVLERITGASMSQYARIDDMVRGIKRTAREALDYGED